MMETSGDCQYGHATNHTMIRFRCQSATPAASVSEDSRPEPNGHRLLLQNLIHVINRANHYPPREFANRSGSRVGGWEYDL